MSYAKMIPYFGAAFGALYDHIVSVGGADLKEENSEENKQRAIDAMAAYMNYGMSPPSAQFMTDLSVDYTLKDAGTKLINTLNDYVNHFTPEELEAAKFIGDHLLALGNDPKVAGLMLAYKGGPPGFDDIGELDDAGHVPAGQQSPLPFYLVAMVAAKALDGDIDKTVEATMASAMGFKDALFANTEGVPDEELYAMCTTHHYKPGFMEAGRETWNTTCVSPPWNSHRFGQACIAAIAAAKANKAKMMLNRNISSMSMMNRDIIGRQATFAKLQFAPKTPSAPATAPPKNKQALAAAPTTSSATKVVAVVAIAGLAAGAYWYWRKKRPSAGRA